MIARSSAMSRRRTPPPVAMELAYDLHHRNGWTSVGRDWGRSSESSTGHAVRGRFQGRVNSLDVARSCIHGKDVERAVVVEVVEQRARLDRARAGVETADRRANNRREKVN